jgi:hypothetical protein
MASMCCVVRWRCCHPLTPLLYFVAIATTFNAGIIVIVIVTVITAL